MSTELVQPTAKLGDMVETPTGRMGRVMAVVPGGRREIQYVDRNGGNVILRAELLRVRVVSTPEPWRRRVL